MGGEDNKDEGLCHSPSFFLSWSFRCGSPLQCAGGETEEQGTRERDAVMPGIVEDRKTEILSTFKAALRLAPGFLYISLCADAGFLLLQAFHLAFLSLHSQCENKESNEDIAIIEKHFNVTFLLAVFFFFLPYFVSI